MSKSVGNVLSPHDLVNRYGKDQTRYFLMREIPHGQDGNFAHDQAVLRINSDLANSLGNLAQRTLSMIAKNCEEAVPQPGPFTEDDKALLDLAHIRMLPTVRHEYDRFYIHRAIEEIMRVAYEANSYIDRQAPWALKKTDLARMNTVLYVLAEVVRCLALIMQPLTPDAAARLLDQLAVAENERSFAFIGAQHALKAGVKLPPPQGVFPRMDVEEQKAAG